MFGRIGRDEGGDDTRENYDGDELEGRILLHVFSGYWGR
jgi:hypothetical protein